jgi:hypothetical protein
MDLFSSGQQKARAYRLKGPQAEVKGSVSGNTSESTVIVARKVTSQDMLTAGGYMRHIVT